MTLGSKTIEKNATMPRSYDPKMKVNYQRNVLVRGTIMTESYEW